MTQQRLLISIMIANACAWPANASPSLASASQALPDKSAYNLFNPTPRDLMRELSTDRPDTTESPYTVDAGHMQLEMSFVEYSRERSSDAWTIAPFNLKLGLLNNADVQIVFEPYILERDGDEAEGIGPTQIRLKINMWGNDGGQHALAIMPFIKLPTEDDDVGNQEVEGGLIVPFATDLPNEWGLGLMAEFDVVYDEYDDSYDLEFVHTAALGHAIVEPLGGYVEYIGIASTDSASDYRALLGAGLTYALNADTQLDGGINFGLTDEADDIAPFVGISIRF